VIYLYSYSKKCKFNIYDRRKRLRQGITDMFLKFHYDLSEKESIYVSRGPRLEKFRFDYTRHNTSCEGSSNLKIYFGIMSGRHIEIFLISRIIIDRFSYSTCHPK
jgi:hypothetical protein